MEAAPQVLTSRVIVNWFLNGSQLPAIRFLDGMRRPVSDDLRVE
jgi:hypothetical protein